MQPVYTFLANLLPPTGQTDAACFAALACAVREWVGGEYPGQTLRTDGTPTTPAHGHLVTLDATKIDSGHDLITLDWSQPGESPDIRLVCTVELARVPLGLETKVSVRAAAGYAGAAPANVWAYRPGIIDKFLSLAGGMIGGQPIPCAVRHVGVQFVPGFVDDLLLNPSRALPVIVLSPHPQTHRPIVDPEKLLDEVFGLAHVVELLHRDTTFALTNCIGKEWSCFYGAIRVYWPGLTADQLNEDFRRHPIFFPDHYPPGDDADVRLPQDILQRLTAWANLRFADAPFVRQARAAADRMKQAAVQKQLAELTAGVEQSKEYARYLELAWDENRKLKDDAELRNLELAEARDELTRQKEQWATVAVEIADAKAETERQARAAARYRDRVLASLRRVTEVIDLAKDEFADVFEFLPDAEKSAADSPYLTPRRVYDLFAALAVVMHELQAHDSLGEPLYDRLKRLGFEYKDRISTTAEGKFGDEYTFMYRGAKRLFENHVTLGKSHNPQDCLSVHWLRDEERKRFVVGWCGKHRTNTRT